MRAGLVLLLILLYSVPGSAQPLQQVLSRLSEEGEAVRLTAPYLPSCESLARGAIPAPKRFRLRLGNAALEPPKPQYRTREAIFES